MHKHHLLQLIFPCAIIAAATTTQAATITTDTEYSTVPSEKLHVGNGAKLTFSFNSDTTFTNTITCDSGAIIQFRNTSPNTTIAYTTKKATIASNSIYGMKGSLIVGSYDDSYATIIDFESNQEQFSLNQDLIIYGNSEFHTNGGTTNYSDIKGQLCSLRTASSLTPQEAASSGPTIGASLDLSSLQTLTIEQSINLVGHKLRFAKSREKAITLTLADDLISNINGENAYTLFTKVGGVDDFKQGTAYNASDYFSSSYIDENTKLILNKDGSLILTGLVDVIPEPSTASLSLLALLGLSLRRRRG